MYVRFLNEKKTRIGKHFAIYIRRLANCPLAQRLLMDKTGKRDIVQVFVDILIMLDINGTQHIRWGVMRYASSSTVI